MGPTVTPVYNTRHDYWYLAWGPETFYDGNIMRIWDTKEEAIEWVKTNRPELKIVDKEKNG